MQIPERDAVLYACKCFPLRDSSWSFLRGAVVSGDAEVFPKPLPSPGFGLSAQFLETDLCLQCSVLSF